ncbi:MAG: asparagine synthase (glutamine-hydrolyzing), partial [Actinomycetes bacterium]
LVRDRMGEKPLFYGTLGAGEVVFGSSLDALRAHRDFDRPVDRDALALYFRHKYVPAPYSIFAGIRKLEPGHLVTVRRDGTVSEPTAYWSVASVAARGRTWTGTPAEAVDHLEHLLRTSVRRRMIADVPVGAFLSGGVDSSTVVAVAQQESATPLRTFTIGSTNPDFDESSDARAVADHVGCDHTELVVTGDDALAVVDQLGTMYDEPFGDSSQIPTRLVSELARSQVTVALSGDAGDELFGGYNRYVWVPAIWDRIGRVPVGARRVGARVGRMVPPSWWDRAATVLPRQRRPQQLGLKISKVLDVADAASAEAVFARLVSHWDQPDALVKGAREPLTAHNDPDQQPAAADIVQLMMLVDSVTYLPDDILAKVDRAAMSVSLETRIPLLDRDIVEFALGLPQDLYVRDGTTKWLLRQVLSRFVPNELIDRPKAGFGLPIDEWLRGPLKDWALDHLRGPECAAFLNTELVESAWNDHQSGRRNMAYELWDVLMFSVWCRTRGITA